MKAESKRIWIFDNIKCILILTVVVGHFVDLCMKQSYLFRSLSLFIYSFHIPLFFVIAGYFHSNNNVRKKICVNIILGLMTRCMMFMISVLLGNNPGLSLLKEGGIPWFLYAFAAFMGITYIIRDMNSLNILVISIILGCFAGYDKSISDFLVLSRIMVFYPFYLAGVLLKKQGVLKRLRVGDDLACNKKYAILGWAMLIVWAGACVWLQDKLLPLRTFFTGRNPYTGNFFLPDGVIRCLCYCLTFVLCLVFICIAPNKKISVITGTGQKTLQVYLWHYIFIYFLQKIHIVDICTESRGKVIYIMIAVILTFFLTWDIFSVPIKLVQKCAEQSLAD